MDRRTFVGVAAGAATLSATIARAADVSDNALAGVGMDWKGAGALSGGKGYAPTPLGQIHYRAVGEGAGTAILLIHQTPIGMAEYVDVVPALVRGGRRVIVSDNPGYGMSDPAPDGVTIADLADNITALLDHLKVARVIVAGHHTGAAIAACFAARHPDRTAGVVLHGSPIYTPAEQAERLARPSAGPELKADGSHFTDTFRSISTLISATPEQTASVTWAVLGQYLSTPHSPVYKAVFSNDMAPDIKAIRAPGLVLTDSSDSLRDHDKRVAALRPDFTLREFSTGKSFALMRQPQRWADMVLAFAEANRI